ncbi:hypothetical protein BT63DRAFT_423332 [Microthyrium microscopicum]|uniref:Endonuclease/exonuclease/phosphatase domain-containing protein n=1 Tax=Microthyrium microscopicum TaxID=703497 RepID=A0A6A6UJ38_9PEZI|nr:hypothetical protein BT63DRAFT_423332 [Microthyrium microscopicum]
MKLQTALLLANLQPLQAAMFALPLRILTHNIRYATTSPFKGEELWQPLRAPRLINELRFNLRPSPNGFICLQEVLHDQLMDILTGLNGNETDSALFTPPHHYQEPLGSSQVPEWAYIGVGRDDGKTAGEYAPILYRPSIWKLLEFKTIWLSETPDVPSKGWDAASFRILTIGVFEHIATGQQVTAMNTHYDDQGSIARYQSSLLILREVTRWKYQYPSSPIFLAGDFNSERWDEPIEVIDRNRIVLKFAGAPWGQEYGDNNTFTGFGFDEPKKIDWIFLSYQSWEVDTYAVLPNVFEDGVYLSDHRAIVTDVHINGLVR